VSDKIVGNLNKKMSEQDVKPKSSENGGGVK
jgi:hypothetical protein